MDRIVIPDLPLEARVGVTDEEQAEPQQIIVRLVLHLDLALAASTDDLARTVDYDAVCATAAAAVAGERFRLIEAIAGRVADAVLDAFGVARVDVRVEKPQALRGRGVSFAAVEISRERNG